MKNDWYLYEYFVDLFPVCKTFVFGHLEINLRKVTIFSIKYFPQTYLNNVLIQFT